MILAIDPGNDLSGYVVLDEVTENIISFGKEPNEILYSKISEFSKTCGCCCIEQISAYGVVGSSVIDTCVWIGVFCEKFGRSKTEFFFRKTIVTYHTGSPKGNDTAIRSVMISRFGNGNPKIRQKGTKLEGITADMWSALAIAVYKSDMLTKRSWHGSSGFVNPVLIG